MNPRITAHGVIHFFFVECTNMFLFIICMESNGILCSDTLPWHCHAGDVSGFPGGGPNFLIEYAPDFANYLADVVQNFEINRAIGIRFDSISPFNEPLEGWWGSGRNKEGCTMTIDDISAITASLGDTLLARGLNTSISIMDSWAYQSFGALTGGSSGKISDQALQAVSTIGVHGYLSPTENGQEADQGAYSLLQGAAENIQKEIWQTEW